MRDPLPVLEDSKPPSGLEVLGSEPDRLHGYAVGNRFLSGADATVVMARIVRWSTGRAGGIARDAHLRHVERFRVLGAQRLESSDANRRLGAI